ncbi:hypothetical protein PI125_g24201 [Phytophthora idaei]|nr:hypothetical protein PI125_g24201 [Phytophthora idaei]
MLVKSSVRTRANVPCEGCSADRREYRRDDVADGRLTADCGVTLNQLGVVSGKPGVSGGRIEAGE